MEIAARLGGFSVICPKWSDFLNSLEPILRKNANCEPRRLSAAGGRAPPDASFAFFLRFPRRISFLSEKDVAGGTAIGLATLAAYFTSVGNIIDV